MSRGERGVGGEREEGESEIEEAEQVEAVHTDVAEIEPELEVEVTKSEVSKDESDASKSTNDETNEESKAESVTEWKDEKESELTEQRGSEESREGPLEKSNHIATDAVVDTADTTETADTDDEFGDFDDFGEFDEGEVDGFDPEPEPDPPTPTTAAFALKETDFASSAQLQASILDIVANIYDDPDPLSRKSTAVDDHKDTSIDSNSYFSQRSASLWSQLAILTPDIRPVDWKRSAIRRLMLISLGVPLDLDEILPRKNTKRLILPMTKESHQKPKDSGQTGQAHQPGQKSDARAQENEKLAHETDSLVAQWTQLVRVSQEAIQNMSEQELSDHVSKLKAATEAAEEVFTKWDAKKQTAVKDKEAFEGVIESLVEYAQRIRKK